jgi:hypothetical protein
VALTYAAFKRDISRTLWRTGDIDFEADLGWLIVMAEARLSRDLHVLKQLTVLKGTVENAWQIPYPADYHGIESLKLDTVGDFRYVTSSKMNELRDLIDNHGRQGWQLYTTRDQIELAMNIGSPAVPYTLTYYGPVPPFATTTDPWTLGSYRDVYTYAVLLECAPYLRDDDRIPVWEGQYAARLAEVKSDDERSRRGSSPLVMSMPSVVA